MSSPTDFIEALVDDLTPVQPAPGGLRSLVVWSVLCWGFVSAFVLLGGPIREGALASALDSPRFMLELAIAIGTGLTALVAALELGVPGTPARLRLGVLPLLLLSGWLVLALLALEHPVVPPSMAGKRPHCFVQSIGLALPPGLLAFGLLRRRVALAGPAAGLRVGLLAGVAASAIPAFWMQLACMYDPLHALQFHLSPIAVFATAGALIAARLLPRM